MMIIGQNLCQSLSLSLSPPHILCCFLIFRRGGYHSDRRNRDRSDYGYHSQRDRYGQHEGHSYSRSGSGYYSRSPR